MFNCDENHSFWDLQSIYNCCILVAGKNTKSPENAEIKIKDYSNN